MVRDDAPRRADLPEEGEAVEQIGSGGQVARTGQPATQVTLTSATNTSKT